MPSSCRAAVVQMMPVLLDAAATTAKVCRLIDAAAAQGARLIRFPEATIPAYPRGMSFGTVVGSRSEAGRRAYARYWEHAVAVPGPATAAIGEAAAAPSSIRWAITWRVPSTTPRASSAPTWTPT